MLGALVLPVNAHDPPASTVVEQLNAVNAAHKRLPIIGVVARFVRAPNVSNAPKLFRPPRNLLFKESVVRDMCGAAGNEAIDV